MGDELYVFRGRGRDEFFDSDGNAIVEGSGSRITMTYATTAHIYPHSEMIESSG